MLKDGSHLAEVFKQMQFANNTPGGTFGCFLIKTPLGGVGGMLQSWFLSRREGRTVSPATNETRKE